MRISRLLLLAFVLLETSGLPALGFVVVEHLDCEEHDGDGCCADACSDEPACDDCACCFHVRPMIAADVMSAAPGRAELERLVSPRVEAPSGHPHEILHVPRIAA